MTLLPGVEQALTDAIAGRARGRRRMPASRRLVAAAVGVLVALTGVAGAAVLLVDRPVAPQATRPLPSLTGAGTQTLAGYRGRALIVTFYASWCGPCRREAAIVNRVAARLRSARTGAGVLVANHDRAAETIAFARHAGLTLAVLGDPHGRMARAYGISGIPATFVLDPEGRIAATAIGWDSEARLRAQVAAALAPSG
jgi:peroxiredoxin